MAKNNIRSFRFSDEVAAVLEGQEGSSLNDKFENLVLFCYYKLEKRQQDLANIEEQISQRQEKLRALQHATDKLTDLEWSITRAKDYFQMVEQKAKEVAEAATKEL